jgi:hypothetical protein
MRVYTAQVCGPHSSRKLVLKTDPPCEILNAVRYDHSMSPTCEAEQQQQARNGHSDHLQVPAVQHKVPFKTTRTRCAGWMTLHDTSTAMVSHNTCSRLKPRHL